MKYCLLIIIALLFCLNIACAQNSAVIKYTDSSKIVIGKASFYSNSLEGTKTAIGSIFHHKRMTAACNFFKLGTWVRVTRIYTGESIIVFINDHMGKHMAKKGRVIDLSRSAASKLNFLRLGITKVKVEEVPKGTEE